MLGARKMGNGERSSHLWLLVGGVAAAGCLAAGPELATPPGTPADRPAAGWALPAGALAAARERLDDAEIVELPALEAWPRSIRTGRLYGLFQVSPLVAQMGVLADASRADAGFGIGVVFGYRFLVGGTTTLGVEFVNEESWHRNPASDVQGLASRTGVGARVSFRVDEKMHPFALAGVGSYTLDFEELGPEYDLSGGGVFFGGGVDFALKRNFSARAELVMHVWDAAEPSGHGGVAETLGLGLGAAVSF